MYGRPWNGNADVEAFERNEEASAAIRALNLSDNEMNGREPSSRGLEAVQAAIKKGLFPNLKLLKMRDYSFG